MTILNVLKLQSSIRERHSFESLYDLAKEAQLCSSLRRWYGTLVKK